MKLVSQLMKLAVVLMAFPVVVLLLLEGACLVLTDKIPGILKKLSPTPSRTSR